MLEDYQNKVCVVTGAASGIGKALCEKLVALGAQVYALDRNKADIEGLSAFVGICPTRALATKTSRSQRPTAPSGSMPIIFWKTP